MKLSPERLKAREQYLKWYAKNGDKARANSRRYYVANKDKMVATAGRWARANPVKMKEGRLRRKYGLSLAEHTRMLVDQQSCCAACGELFEGFPFTDHCHATGKVRGLLCRDCNFAIGLLRDSPARCRMAAEYLERHEKFAGCSSPVASHAHNVKVVGPNPTPASNS